MSEKSVAVTWERAAKIWWALAWRGVLIGGLVGVLAGVIMGIVAAVLGTDLSAHPWPARLIGLLVGVPIGILVVRHVLRLPFSDFRIELIALVPMSTSASEDDDAKSS